MPTVDTTDPVFNTITPFQAECSSTTLTADITAWLNGVSATDNCAETITITNDYNAASLPASGCAPAITITFIAADECGNTAQTTSTITIVDTTDPVLNTITPFQAECSSTTLTADITAWLN